MDILDLEMQTNDAEAKTVRDYLKALLTAVWEQDECFSGKRPFGNSGWKYDLYIPLVKAGVISGKLDADGYIEECADGEADALIAKAIQRLK
jgi:hypothetical protein